MRNPTALGHQVASEMRLHEHRFGNAIVEAERAIIEAQKSNDLLAAEQDLAINQALAEAATAKAKADLAIQMALAKIYADHPGFLQLQIVQANADAIQPTDKLIFTPEGTVPNRC